MPRKENDQRWQAAPQLFTVSALAEFVPSVRLGRVSNHPVLSWGTRALSFVDLRTQTPHLSGQVSYGMHRPTPWKEKASVEFQIVKQCDNAKTTTWFLLHCTTVSRHVMCLFFYFTCTILSTLSCRTNGGLFLGMIDRTRTPSTKSRVVTRMWNL